MCVSVDGEDASELTGMTNLMSYYGLEHSYNKFSSKKVKEELSAFLPTLPGNIDTSGNQDNRSHVFNVSRGAGTGVRGVK